MEIITFGNGEILKGIFDAIAMCLNPETGTLYTPLIRIGIIFSVLWAALYSLWGDYLRVWGQAIIPFVFIPPLLFIPTSTVYIHDAVSNTREKVDNVPFGLAYFSHFVSKFGYEMTRQVDRVFAQVDDLKYHKSGFLMASNLIQQAKTFHITNEDIAENMRQFVTQCVAMEAMLGRKYTIEDLRSTSDIWGLVSSNPSPIRSFLWRDPYQTPVVVSCQEGVQRFNQIWEPELDKAKSLFGVKFFSMQDPIKAKQELLKYLPISYEYLTGISKSADQILKQQMMIHSVVDGIEQKSVALGNAPNFAARRAYLQQRSTYETLGAMASETLMTMKSVLEAITYVAFIFVVPLAVLPFGVKILLSWAQTLLWLQMWAPLYAALNFIMTTTARYKSMGLVSLSNPDGVTIASSVGLANLNADMSAMAGYLAMSIPFLAIALVKGVSSFVHMASHLGNVSQSTASQAAADSVTGNYSFGNISEGNQQIANQSMFSESRAATYRASSFQTIDGRTDMTTMSDGSQVVNIGVSNLPNSVNVTESMSGQSSEMAAKNYQKSLGLSESSGKSLSSSYRDVVDLSDSIANSESLGKSLGQGITSDQVQSIHKSKQLVQEFADSINTDTTTAGNILGQVSAGGKFIIGGSIEASGTISGSNQNLYQKTKKFMEDNNFQSAMNSASQASKNLSHSFTDENSKRLAESFSGSYETGMQQRSEASKHFNEAESYAAQAQYIKANSAAINANYNQQYADWLADQSLNHSGGRMGSHEAASIMANDPKLAMEYANRFAKDQGLISNKSLGMDVNSIQQSYNSESRHHRYSATRGILDDIRQKGEKMGLHDVSLRGQEFDDSTQSMLNQRKKKISQGSRGSLNDGEAVKEKVLNEQKRNISTKVSEKGWNEIKETAQDLGNIFREAQKK